jgi:hypothetical protein
MDLARDIAEGAMRVVALSLFALMLLAATHKLRLVANGAAATQPLMQLAAWRRRHAAWLLGGAAVVELAIAGVLIAAPVAGMAAVLALLAVYSTELRRLAKDEDCGCLGNFLSASRNAALRRNLVIASVTVAALAATATGTLAPAPISQATVGAALIVLVGALVPLAGPPGITRRAGVAAEAHGRRGGGWLAS